MSRKCKIIEHRTKHPIVLTLYNPDYLHIFCNEKYVAMEISEKINFPRIWIEASFFVVYFIDFPNVEFRCTFFYSSRGNILQIKNFFFYLFQRMRNFEPKFL